MVNDVRFKGLEEGDAARWLACLGAARGASAKGRGADLGARRRGA